MATPTPPADAPQPPQIPTGSWRRAGVLVGRALTHRCPYCGRDNIFAGWWSLRERCPHCGVSFEREEGYFLGAYAINLIVAELLGLAILVVILLRADLSVLQLQVLGVALMVGLPLLGFPYSRTLWMALDFLLHPPVDA